MADIKTSSKFRSPNYPAISLGEAVDRIKKVYAGQRLHPSSREVIAKLLGYSGLSGTAGTIVSALAKYDLLEGHGPSLRVSEVGMNIALYRQGDAEYEEALKHAAFAPQFFRELHDQYPDGLPSEHLLFATLSKRGFNPKAIEGAIRSYSDTLTFLENETGGSGVESIEIASAEGALQSQNYSNVSISKNPFGSMSTSTGIKAVQIPYSPEVWATIQAPFPLTEEAWDAMLKMLQNLKPGLVSPKSPDSNSTDPD